MKHRQVCRYGKQDYDNNAMCLQITPQMIKKWCLAPSDLAATNPQDWWPHLAGQRMLVYDLLGGGLYNEYKDSMKQIYTRLD